MHLSLQCLACLTFLHPARQDDQGGLGEAIAEGPGGLTRVAGHNASVDIPHQFQPRVPRLHVANASRVFFRGMAELFVAQDLLKDFTEKTQTKDFAMSFRWFLLRGASLERAALSSLYAPFVVSCEVLVLKPALICHVDAVGVPSFLPLKHQRSERTFHSFDA